jgi:two-component system chemotaxis response regulator CheY
MVDMRALVVDDSGAIRTYLRRILAAHGFDVIEAKNGREALERLQAQEGVDLVLLDWNMPEMSGIEFLARLRAEPAFNHVCVMMVTTETELPEITSALNAGANEYVMKPFTPEIIEEKLQLLGFSMAVA